MKCRPAVAVGLSALVVASTLVAFDVAAATKKKPKLGVVAVITDGIAEHFGAAKHGKKKAKRAYEIGHTFAAICDGQIASWKLSDYGDDGAFVGAFVGPSSASAKPHHCMMVDAPGDPAAAAKGRAVPSKTEVDAAKSAAVTALTPKKGEAPSKVDLVVFHDGVAMIAVAQAQRPASGKTDCLDQTGLVVLEETDKGWKTVFRPSPKGKGTCGYTYFTRGDVDGDGRDEIALRVEKSDGYGYRVLKRKKGSYDVVAK
jgi:hypothetical protein